MLLYGATRHSITTLSITTLDTVMRSVIYTGCRKKSALLSVILLCRKYAHYAECHYAKSRYA